MSFRMTQLRRLKIAATALANDLILVTRNTKDFEPIAKITPLKLENWFET